MESVGTPTQQIARILVAISRRLALARLLPNLALICALGCAMFIFSIASQGLAGRTTLLPILAFTALAATIAAAIELLRHPNLPQTARRTDFDLRLAEILSTAIDVPGDSPVARSLHAEAQRIASGIAIPRAIPVLSRLLAVSFAVLLVALGSATAAYVLVGNTAATPLITAEAIANPAETPLSADDIDAVAQLLADDADRRDSDYLEAVASSLQDLAEAARAGKPQPELRAELQALLDHAAAGYEGQRPEWLANTPGDPGAILQNARAFSETRQQAAAERALSQENGTRPKSLSANMYDLPQDRLAQGAIPSSSAADQPTENGAAQREGELQNASLGGGEYAAKPMEDEAFESAGSLPVGAAAQSGKGESNIAGGGTQALAESTGFLETMADPTQAMSISSDGTEEGSSIRMHVPTSATPSTAGDLSDDAAGEWARQSAQIVSRQTVAPQSSAVVARYFNRPAMPADAGP